MTHPGRVRRGYPARHLSTRHRASEHAAQRPEPDLATSTSPGPITTDSDEFAGRGHGRQSRRSITRPPASGSSGKPAAPPATSSSTIGDPRSAEPLLFTAEQAASRLQVRPSWLRRKAAARAVPCRFVGKHLRFSRADIETIAEGNTP
jgi:helix-turn-helix protein